MVFRLVELQKQVDEVLSLFDLFHGWKGEKRVKKVVGHIPNKLPAS